MVKAECLVATLAPRGRQRHGQAIDFPKRLHFADELVACHTDILGR